MTTNNPYYVCITNIAYTCTDNIGEVKYELQEYPINYAEVYRIPTQDECMDLVKYLVPQRLTAYSDFLPTEPYGVSTAPGATAFPKKLKMMFAPYPNQNGYSRIPLDAPTSSTLSYDVNTTSNQLSLDSYNSQYSNPITYDGSQQYWSCFALNAYGVCIDLDKALHFLRDSKYYYPGIKLFFTRDSTYFNNREEYMHRYQLVFPNTSGWYIPYPFNEICLNDTFEEDRKKEVEKPSMVSLLKAGIIGKF